VAENEGVVDNGENEGGPSKKRRCESGPPKEGSADDLRRKLRAGILKLISKSNKEPQNNNIFICNTLSFIDDTRGEEMAKFSEVPWKEFREGKVVDGIKLIGWPTDRQTYPIIKNPRKEVIPYLLGLLGKENGINIEKVRDL
jgi:hypothetical protein